MANVETRLVDWADIRSRPTEAVPKHTLFGTQLEQLSDEDKKNADRLFIQNEIEKRNANPSTPSFKYIGAGGKACACY